MSVRARVDWVANDDPRTNASDKPGTVTRAPSVRRSH